MLHFDVNPIEIGYLVLQSCEGLVDAKNNVNKKDLNTDFANITKTISVTSNSFLLIMSLVA